MPKVCRVLPSVAFGSAVGTPLSGLSDGCTCCTLRILHRGTVVCEDNAQCSWPHLITDLAHTRKKALSWVP